MVKKRNSRKKELSNRRKSNKYKQPGSVSRKVNSITKEEAAEILGINKNHGVDKDRMYFTTVLSSLQAPKNIKQYLKDNDIESFADVWRKDLDFETKTGKIDSQFTSKFLAHTRLAVISEDLQINSTLIEAGVSGIIDLVNKKDTDVIKKLVVSEQGQLQLQQQAHSKLQLQVDLNSLIVRAQYICSLMRMNFVELASGYTKGTTRSNLMRHIADSLIKPSELTQNHSSFREQEIQQSVQGEGCSICDECMSSLSTSAYLNSLVDEFVKYSFPSRFPDITSLNKRFFRSFSDLQIGCSNADQRVLQIEISNKVLEEFIRSLREGLSRDQLYAEFAQASLDYPKKDIVSKMFDSYLNEMGTSKMEIEDALDPTDPDKLSNLLKKLPGLNESNIREIDPSKPITISVVDKLPSFIIKVKRRGIDINTDPIGDLSKDRALTYYNGLSIAEGSIAYVKEITSGDVRENLIYAAISAIKSSSDDKIRNIKNSKDLGNFLHIDLSTNSSVVTTNIDSAIEALQSFIFAFLLGREKVDLSIPRSVFELRWNWLQSYDLWRAARSIQIYPENFLLPTLRRNMTPRFKELVNTLTTHFSANTITPELVREALLKYEQFNPEELTILATCVLGNKIVVLARNSNLEFIIGYFTLNGEWIGWIDIQGIQGDFSHMVSWNDRIYIFGHLSPAFPDSEKLAYISGVFSNREFLFNKIEIIQGIGYADIVAPIHFIPRPEALYIYTKIQSEQGYSVHSLAVGGEFRQNIHRSPNDDNWDFILKKPGSLGHMHYLTVEYPTANPDPIFVRVILKKVDTSKAEWPVTSHPPDLFQFFDAKFKSKFLTAVNNNNNKLCMFAYTREDAFIVGQIFTYNEQTQIFTSDPTTGSVGRIEFQSVPISIEWFNNDLYLFGNDRVVVLHQNSDGTWTILKHIKFATWLPTSDRLPRPSTEDISSEYYSRYIEEQKRAFQNYTPNDPAYVYLEEYFLYIPLIAAHYLSESKYFLEADLWLRLLYNPYYNVNDNNIIYFPLLNDIAADSGLSDNFPIDLLDPYVLVKMKKKGLLHHITYTYLENLVDWADSEYSRDTIESVNKAREVYEIAEDISTSKYIPANDCISAWDGLVNTIRVKYDLDESHILQLLLFPVKSKLGIINIHNVQDLIQNTSDYNELLRKVKKLVDEVLKQVKKNNMTLGGVHNKRKEWENHEVGLEDGYLKSIMNESVTPYEKNPITAINYYLNQKYNGIIPKYGTSPNLLSADMLLIDSKSILSDVNSGFCIQDNSISDTLRMRIKSNLGKIRSDKNFAGMQRNFQTLHIPVDPLLVVQRQFSGYGRRSPEDIIPNEPPPLYRYSYLIERARFYVSTAQQMEQLLLHSFEAGDRERYDFLKAKQDLKISEANVSLQELRMQEAYDSVELARKQQDRAQVQFAHFDSLVKNKLSDYEKASLAGLERAIGYTQAAADFATAAAISSTISSAVSGVATGVTIGGPVGAVIGLLSGLFGAGSSALSGASQYRQYKASLGSLDSQLASTQATFERRQQDWMFQRDLANQDIEIGTQGIDVANDRFEITEKERDVARLHSVFALDMVNFLGSKFTNADLYDWMERLVRRYYRQHLDLATVIARMAQSALAFERQEPISMIANHYSEREKKDLLSAEQLLTDINKLDYHRLTTEKRRRELTKVISLSSAAPIEFENLRKKGWMEFVTLMEWFDRDFPGHYMRLIKSISLTVVGLISPTESIHATLSNNGLSRIVVGPPLYDTRTIRHHPQSIAISGTNNGTGLFELRLDDPILLPFENNGVESVWTLELPKGANRFNYDTLFDILLTIRYSALEDLAYREIVLKRMGNTIQGQTYYSLSNDYPDEWYHLNNPEPGQIESSIQFEITTSQFPPNESIEKMIRLNIILNKNKHVNLPIEIKFQPQKQPEVTYVVQKDYVWDPNNAESVPFSVDTFTTPPTALATLEPFGLWTLTLKINREIEKAKGVITDAKDSLQLRGSGKPRAIDPTSLDLSWLNDIVFVISYDAKVEYNYASE